MCGCHLKLEMDIGSGYQHNLLGLKFSFKDFITRHRRFKKQESFMNVEKKWFHLIIHMHSVVQHLSDVPDKFRYAWILKIDKLIKIQIENLTCVFCSIRYVSGSNNAIYIHCIFKKMKRDCDGWYSASNRICNNEHENCVHLCGRIRLTARQQLRLIVVCVWKVQVDYVKRMHSFKWKT